MSEVGEGIVDALRVIIDRVNELEREKVLLQQACALRAEQRDIAIRERDVLRLTGAKAGRLVDELQAQLANAESRLAIEKVTTITRTERIDLGDGV